MDELSERLRKTVDVLAELIGQRNTNHTEGLDAARAFLRRELRGMGHNVSEQWFDSLNRKALNLEVVLKGSKSSQPTLVVGAHYDSAPGTPGADDNASAVAILLEIARSLAGQSLRRTLRIVFYDCEEPPHFNFGEMGSQWHARELRKSGEKVLGMICLESLGYFPERVEVQPGTPFPLRWANRLFGGRFVVIVSNVKSAWFNTRFLARFMTSGRFPFLPASLPVKWVPHIALSDHRGYWEQGFNALMVTDTAILRNSNYHTMNDRLATLDFDRMTKLCRQITRSVVRMCR